MGGGKTCLLVDRTMDFRQAVSHYGGRLRMVSYGRVVISQLLYVPLHLASQERTRARHQQRPNTSEYSHMCLYVHACFYFILFYMVMVYLQISICIYDIIRMQQYASLRSGDDELMRLRFLPTTNRQPPRI